MAIKRCSDQKSKTLIEFYSELLSSEHISDTGKGMLAFIEMINQTFVETDIFGLTSHNHLVLLSEDDYRSDWFVIVIFCFNKYHLEYKMPEDISPWKDGTVKGVAGNIDDAKKYLVIAMTECRGWRDSEELEKLYASQK